MHTLELDDCERSSGPATASTPDQRHKWQMQFLEMEVLSVNCNTSLSHTVVVRIFHELRFRMFCAYCMPHISFLKHYAAKSHEFVECLVTGGETLVHHHILAMCKH